MIEALTSLPDLSLAFFTLPYVPFPRVSRNSYRCFKLCLWWCLFTACLFKGTCAGALPTGGFDDSRPTLKPSIPKR